MTVFAFFALIISSFGQTSTFPKREIMDVNTSSMQMSKLKLDLDKYHSTTDSLFKYSKDSVIYIINGKPLSDINYIRKELFANGEYIETISTSEYNLEGKRLITIKYKPHL